MPTHYHEPRPDGGMQLIITYTGAEWMRLVCPITATHPHTVLTAAERAACATGAITPNGTTPDTGGGAAGHQEAARGLAGDISPLRCEWHEGRAWWECCGATFTGFLFIVTHLCIRHGWSRAFAEEVARQYQDAVDPLLQHLQQPALPPDYPDETPCSTCGCPYRMHVHLAEMPPGEESRPCMACGERCATFVPVIPSPPETVLEALARLTQARGEVWDAARQADVREALARGHVPAQAAWADWCGTIPRVLPWVGEEA